MAEDAARKSIAVFSISKPNNSRFSHPFAAKDFISVYLRKSAANDLSS